MASSQNIAIAYAFKAGTLRLAQREGRFGAFVAICDDFGTIEVVDTLAEATARIADVRGRVA